MARTWKPTAAQKKAFAEKMQNETLKKEYESKKEAKQIKRRATSKFDYATAGGEFIPTKKQYMTAFRLLQIDTATIEQLDAARMVVDAYISKTTTHHDNIHIINEFLRNKK
jgi:hypothetical protein